MKNTLDRILRVSLLFFAILDALAFVLFCFPQLRFAYEEFYNAQSLMATGIFVRLGYLLLALSTLFTALGLLFARRWAIALYALGLPLRYAFQFYTFTSLLYLGPWSTFEVFITFSWAFIVLEVVRFLISVVAFRRVSAPEWPHLFPSWSPRTRRNVLAVAVCLLIVSSIIVGWDRRTPADKLVAAAQHGYLRTARNLVASGANPLALSTRQGTPLGMALFCREPEIVALFLDTGINVNKPTEGGHTPMSQLFFFTSDQPDHDRKLVATLKVLLDHGADANTPTYYGSPLHAAVIHKSSGAAELLLNHGANINTRDKRGDTPLHMAVDYDALQVVKILVDHGADINILNREDETPLASALNFHKANDEIVTFLRQHGGTK